VLVSFLPGTEVNFDTEARGHQLTGNLHEEKGRGHLLDLDESRTSDSSLKSRQISCC
jgi:hypothetical protein